MIKRGLVQIFLSALVLCGALHMIGWSGKSIDENNPADLLQDAEEDISDGRYVFALDKLKTIKNKFPYSSQATTAKLRIADVHFLEESFVESATAYELFRDMHPKHSKADYVLFRIGESYFSQLPDSHDRDVGAATKAIDSFQEFLKLYPKSEFVPTAREHLNESQEKLAQKEQYVADFYFGQEQYDSAAGRYEKIIKNFADTKVGSYAYWRLGQALDLQGKHDEAIHTYRVYLAQHPDGEYAAKAKRFIEKKGAESNP